MLALFEVLSFKGWLDVRDVLIKAVGPVSAYLAWLNPPMSRHLIISMFRFRFMQFTFTYTYSWAA